MWCRASRKSEHVLMRHLLMLTDAIRILLLARSNEETILFFCEKLPTSPCVHYKSFYQFPYTTVVNDRWIRYRMSNCRYYVAFCMQLFVRLSTHYRTTTKLATVRY